MQSSSPFWVECVTQWRGRDDHRDPTVFYVCAPPALQKLLYRLHPFNYITGRNSGDDYSDWKANIIEQVEDWIYNMDLPRKTAEEIELEKIDPQYFLVLSE